MDLDELDLKIDVDEVPADIQEAANRATLDLLPSKSRQQYDIAYNRFMEWCKLKKVEGKFSESVFLAFFMEKSKIWKSSTLWSNFSMIKASLNIKNDVDIGKYYKLIAFLKRTSIGYRPKKSKILTREHIDRFVNESPDMKYLMVKVATIFGLFGALRREELTKLTVDNIEELGDSLLVHLSDTKTYIQRSFCIVGSYLTYYRKYVTLRPSNVTHRRFFLKYSNNKCTVQPVGINTFGKMPYMIAEFLKLPDPKLFTGHCFRRSSTSLLAESGANITTIKRHGGWKSSSVAEGYIEDSLKNKDKIARNILPSSSSTSSDARENLSVLPTPSDKMMCDYLPTPSCSEGTSNGSSNTVMGMNTLTRNAQGIHINNCSNTNVYINVYK